MDPINDLDRELMATMQVEPSPGFAPRVRARIASEAAAPRWRVPRLALVCGGVALAVLAVKLMSAPQASIASARATVLTHHQLALVVPLRPAVASLSARTVVRPETRMMTARVFVSRSEMLALRGLFAGVMVAPPAAAIADELSIPTLAVDAIDLPAIPEGDRK